LGTKKTFRLISSKKAHLLQLDSSRIATIEPPVEFATQGAEEVDVIEFHEARIESFAAHGNLDRGFHR
jgi:hypothetical protein